MNTTLLFIALVLAILDWVAVVIQWKPLEFIAKPGTMVALLAWLWVVSGFRDGLVWFAVGLVFSLAGDVFLMLPREQFIAGLVSFLMAQIAYIIGFNTAPPPINLASLILAGLVLLTGLQIYRRVGTSLESSGQSSLKAPVLVYSIVISLMLLSALLTLVRPETEWPAGTALLVSGGALLFFVSDTTLAWNKFVASLKRGKLVVIVTYHLGQGLIVLGAALKFLMG